MFLSAFNVILMYFDIVFCEGFHLLGFDFDVQYVSSIYLEEWFGSVSMFSAFYLFRADWSKLEIGVSVNPWHCRAFTIALEM